MTASFPGRKLTEKQQAQIKAISPRIKLCDISDLVNAELSGDFSSRKKLDVLLAPARVYFGIMPPKDIMARAPNLEWIHSILAGTDSYLNPGVIASPVILTKGRTHAVQVAETAFNMMLMLARHSLEYFRNQQQKKWVRIEPDILYSRTIGVLGLGNIGLNIARLAKAFGMKVIAIKAHPEARNRYSNVDVILPPEGLPQVMSQSDFLVIVLPLTPETRNLIGERELNMMKPTAYLINVGRGAIVDEDALVRALKEKRIAGAGLDVFITDPAPLPQNHELWTLPNVIITPHIGGFRPDSADQSVRQFCQNLRRFLSGKELLNVVDKKQGY